MVYSVDIINLVISKLINKQSINKISASTNVSVGTINKWKYLYNDSFKTTFGEMSRNILSEYTFNFEDLISLIGILFGILIYHIIF